MTIRPVAKDDVLKTHMPLHLRKRGSIRIVRRLWFRIEHVAEASFELVEKSEMDALIAYLQVLGTAVKRAK